MLPGEHRLGDEVLQQAIESGIDGTLAIIDDTASGLDEETAARVRLVLEEAPTTGGPLLLDEIALDGEEPWPSGAPLGLLVTTDDDAATVRFGSGPPLTTAALHRECLAQEVSCVVLACPEPATDCLAGVLDAWAGARTEGVARGDTSVDSFMLRLLDDLPRDRAGRLWVSQLRLDPDPSGSVERVVLELHPDS